MLHEAARHERLDHPDWDEDRVRAAIAAIADDAERRRLPDGHWPVHPLDSDPGETVPATGFQSLYLGSAGTLWALWFLQRHGAARPTLDIAEGLRQADARYRAAPDTGTVVPSYHLGEVGILLMRWRVDGGADVADRIHAAVRANRGNPTREALWAAPGTMGAAWHLWQATGEPRWRALFLDNVDELWRTWEHHADAGCHLWTQDLYGRVGRLLGAGHGFAGNVQPLLKGAALLDADRREALYDRCAETLAATAAWDDGSANWPARLGPVPPGRSAWLVQWCHGAPGIVTGLADLPAGRSAALDRLLLGAGETIWRAGPLAKGAGLCHGTAGNGAALLCLYRRTGDAIWLERARAFAMHAIGQCERMRAHHGCGRYTLWTGDPGVAIYLWQCLTGRPGMPALDFID